MADPCPHDFTVATSVVGGAMLVNLERVYTATGPLRLAGEGPPNPEGLRSVRYTCDAVTMWRCPGCEAWLTVGDNEEPPGWAVAQAVAARGR